MKSDDTRTCLVCGTQFPRSKEFCPICILREAMDEQIKPAKKFLKGVPPNRSGRRLSHRFEHYELITDKDGKPVELGRGAMGITFKAYDTNLRFPVALKVINSAYLESDTARQRFLREARAAAALRPPNVASVFNLGTDQGSYFYVMEFIDGETVEALVKRKGALEPAEALNIALQVARALAVAAKQQLVHRDLKPSNLMLVDQEGETLVKVIDFGLAKVTKDDLILDSKFNLDFNTAFPTGPARPHGIAIK